MFQWLGRGIAQRPVIFILAWAMLIATGILCRHLAGPVPPSEVGSFLPPDSPHNKAVALIQKAFPQLAAHSTIVIVAHRPAQLTPDDYQWFDRINKDVAQATEGRVLSPSVPFLRQRLVSRDNQAAMMVVNLSSNFISARTIEVVDRVSEIVHQKKPPGLSVEITGTAGIGRDYFAATKRAAEKTTWVTLASVLIILILVYRSPVGALVPMLSIGVSAYLAFIVLDLLMHIGWEASTMERIFVVVLIFGAGVDFALFWIARYRELLAEQNSVGTSAAGAMTSTGPAILASAATTICGLLTLITADLRPSQNAGRALAVVLTIALLAALTLTPAIARIFGRFLFWPRGLSAKATVGQRVLWPWLADRVVTQPRVVLLAGSSLLILLAALSLRIEPRFDSLSELPTGSSSARGFDLARAHFSKGQLYSNSVLLQFQKKIELAAQLNDISKKFSNEFTRIPGVLDVYSLDSPLGKSQVQATGMIGSLLAPLTRTLYLAEQDVDGSVLRLEVLIDHLPFSHEAIATMKHIQGKADSIAQQISAGQTPTIYIAGPTAYIIDIQKIAGSDQRRVMILATAVITVIVFMMVRHLPLTLFMIFATWLTYGATLTVSQFFFVNIMDLGGLDWKVRLILFVIVVAVGQDYNIFLVSRLLDAHASPDRKEVVRQAIMRTGSVISSCGLIMAATLGSLWAGNLLLLRQLGFALATGILIDTFFVRPLLVPSFFLIFGQARSRAASDQDTSAQTPPA